MSPWEYQEVRRVLGHGSGFDSPGFRDIRRVSPGLLDAFNAVRRERGLSVLEVYTKAREHEDLYQLAEALTEWDERVGVWRFRHYKVVTRSIGEVAIGTQGTPVELLGGLIKKKMFPELWHVRTELTELAANMVFSMHPHAIAADGRECLYMQDTWLVTEDGGVPLAGLPMKIFE